MIAAVGGVTVKRCDRRRERPHEREVELTARGQAIEERGLIEAGHLDHPFHRLARAAQPQRSVALAGDSDHAVVQRRRTAAVDAHLRLAQRLAAERAGEIEIVVTDGALELESALAGQEHDRRVGFDLLDRRAAVSGWRCQELEDLGLVFADHGRLAGRLVDRIRQRSVSRRSLTCYPPTPVQSPKSAPSAIQRLSVSI